MIGVVLGLAATWCALALTFGVVLGRAIRHADAVEVEPRAQGDYWLAAE